VRAHSAHQPIGAIDGRDTHLKDRESTARLELKPLPAAAAAALPHDRETAARLLEATLPPSWPQPDLLDLLPIQAAATSVEERFGVWVMIERETNDVVGDVGFMGPPADGIVELGFSVISDRRRRGYATEAARAMVEWALREPAVRRVVAQCDTDNPASIRVLERAGFVRTGEGDGQIGWSTRATDQP
jgi:[ribosomal protein S5]-alanine N-acetyltransferase